MRAGFLIVFCLMVNSMRAQTMEEWTQQKQTAIKRLVEQIIANKVHLERIIKGYQVVQDGLHTIRSIKDGDFHLHFSFIDSLKIVNPNLKRWIKVADIVNMQLRIVRLGKQVIAVAVASKQLTSAELRYCESVIDQLFRACLQGLDELTAVISSGELSMHDDERMQRIEQLYTDMQERNYFIQSFTEELKILSLQRLTEQTELNYLKK